MTGIAVSMKIICRNETAIDEIYFSNFLSLWSLSRTLI